ncbi:hypothetical protein EON65_01355 [archaeon]|nr:MAG: hypothetical protein EON65_01355 [archaeon]
MKSSHSSPGRLASPARTSSPGRTGSPKKDVTRYGPIHYPEPKFGGEKRFQWQNAASGTSDVSYDLPAMTMSRSVLFAHAPRKGMDDENPDNKKRSTGPGSYDVAHSYDHLSEYVSRTGNMFPCASRQSMAMKTPSPGAVYNIEKKYWNGPDTQGGIGFPQSTRTDLFGRSAGADADLFYPKDNRGVAVTIAGRHKYKPLGSDTPGAVYDVHVSQKTH